MKRLRVASGFALARLRARPAQVVVTTAAIGLVVAALAILVVLPTVGGDLLLRRTLRELEPADRTVTVLLAPETRPTPEELVGVDKELRSLLQLAGLSPLRRVLEYRSLKADRGTLFRLGGVDGLASAYQLSSGRMPASCTPTLCEVVAVGATAPEITLNSQPMANLIVVGRVVQTDGALFTGTLAPNSGEVVLLADGIEPVHQLTDFKLIRRIDAWVAVLDPDQVSRPALAALQTALPQVGKRVSVPGITVIAPDQTLSAAVARADVGGRGLALPLGQTAVLLVGVTVLVAFGLRDRHLLSSDRLARRGADRVVLLWHDVVSAFLSVGAGLVLGTVLGLGASVALLHRLNVAVGPTLRTAWDVSSITVFVGSLAGLSIVTVLLMRLRAPDALAKARRVRGSDLLLLLTTAMVVLTLSRGTTSPGALAAKTDPLLWSLPFMAATALACLAIRVVPLLLGVMGGALPTRFALGRVAFLDATRRPLRPLTTASLMAVAVAFGSFALGYRSTLAQGAREQAAYAVPYDVRLDLGAELVRPIDLMPEGGWQTLVPGTMSTEIARRGVTLRRSGSLGDALDIVGLDPSTLPSLRSPRSDYGPPASQVAKLLASPPVPTIGAPIPAETTRLQVETFGTRKGVEVALVLQGRDGRWREIAAAGPDTAPLSLDVVAGEQARLIGLRVSQPAYEAARVEHAIGEGDQKFVDATSVALDIVRISALSGNQSQLIPVDFAGLVSQQAKISMQPSGALRVEIALQGSAALLLPPAPTEPLTALVDPLTASAANNGRITVETSNATIELNVVATATRFPTLGPRFVVTDQAQLRRRLDLAQPGEGNSSEIWLAADTPANEARLATTLRQPPFNRLTVDRRVTRVNNLHDDPLSRLALAVLIGSAVLAALLAAGALALNAVAERVEDESFHRALRLEGAADTTINRLVGLRALGLALAATPVGLIGGALLLSAIVQVVQISATAVTPSPPLRRIIPWPTLALALACVGALLLLTSAVASRVSSPSARQDLLRGRP
jgi:hypothetical protein